MKNKLAIAKEEVSKRKEMPRKPFPPSKDCKCKAKLVYTNVFELTFPMIPKNMTINLKLLRNFPYPIVNVFPLFLSPSRLASLASDGRKKVIMNKVQNVIVPIT